MDIGTFLLVLALIAFIVLYSRALRRLREVDAAAYVMLRLLVKFGLPLLIMALVFFVGSLCGFGI